MKRFFSTFGCSLLILCVLTARYLSDFNVFQTGIRLLLPVRIETVKTDAFSSSARIRYYNFIPVEDLVKEESAVVVNRFEDGRVRFVSKATGQRLRPREILLNYKIVFPFLPKQDPNVRFAASELRFSQDQPLQASIICYAIVYVGNGGKAFLAGLTDSTGNQLIKGLAFSHRHIF